jgi:inner membrane protein
MAVSGTFARILRSPSFKFVLIGALMLAVSLLLALVWLMLSERQIRASTVQNEIAKDWGGGQRILGPLLIVPYTAKSRAVDQGKQIEIERERLAIFLPDSLNAAAEASTEIRKRSIYNVTVYRSAVLMEGHFPIVDIGLVDSNAVRARWQDAILALGINDVSGLKNNVELEMEGGKTIAFEPSIGVEPASFPGIHARLGLSGGEPGQSSLKSASPFRYKINLDLNGSSYLTFVPVGRDTSVSIKSGWPHPSFTGFLPVSRTVGESGFTAAWRVPHLARSFPQAYSESLEQMSAHRFWNADLGVNLFVPVDFYSLVDRSLKYGFMFIAAVFGAVFVMELLSKQRVHPIQYIFVGLALVIFNVLLLSLSEHTGFTLAYVSASAATSIMISIYTGKALHSPYRGFLMLGIFAILYGLLYLILQLEDYALLAGALTAFALLTAAMFATLRVNWSGDEPQRLSP